MALIIEDGSGRSDSDSYSTAEELVSYAKRYGLTIPDGEEAQEALLRRAALAMDGLSWKGCRAKATQALAWPRRDALVDRAYLPVNLIPGRIAYGQMALAAEIYQDDIDPPEQRKGAVTRERVEGVVDVEYAAISNTSRKLLPAAPDRPSRTQFADYLAKRGLFAVRA